MQMSCGTSFAPGGLRYVDKIGLILCADDGCGGAIIIPDVSNNTTTVNGTPVVGGRTLPSISKIPTPTAKAFDGSAIMYNRGTPFEEFSAFSNDAIPHAYRMITLYNVPLSVLEKGRWTSAGVSQYKGAVGVNTLASTISTNFSAYPIVHLNAAQWKALRDAAKPTTSG